MPSIGIIHCLIVCTKSILPFAVVLLLGPIFYPCHPLLTDDPHILASRRSFSFGDRRVFIFHCYESPITWPGDGKQYLLCPESSLYLSFMQLSLGMSIEIHFSSFAGFVVGHSSLVSSLCPPEAVTVGLGKHSKIWSILVLNWFTLVESLCIVSTTSQVIVTYCPTEPSGEARAWQNDC